MQNIKTMWKKFADYASKLHCFLIYTSDRIICIEKTLHITFLSLYQLCWYAYSNFNHVYKGKKIDLILSINVHCLNEFFKKNISNLLNFTVFYILIEFVGILYALITHLFFIFSKYIKRRCSKSESSKSLWR